MARCRAVAILLVGLALPVVASCGPAGSAPPIGTTPRAAAITPRVPWTTPHVTGSPEPPPPFVAARAFPGVELKNPVCLVAAPGLDRWFAGELGGRIVSFRDAADAEPELAIDLPAELKTIDLLPAPVAFHVFYALAFHPKFTENRFCYVCYLLRDGEDGSRHKPDGSRISRFTVTDTEPPRLDPDSEEILVSWVQGDHNGCDLQFGPDGYLYFSTGDASKPSPPDARRAGQDITNLLSAVLRIDVDRKDPGRNYAVPADNPFVGVEIDGVPARPEIWAYGLRNPWRMSFDRESGDLWVGDVMWDSWELIHRVEKGGNYGWSAFEGPHPLHANERLGPTPIQKPAIELPHTLAASVTGGFVYRGSKFPDLVGRYVFGDWEFRRLWAASFAEGQLESLDEITRPTVRVVSFGEAPDGELFFLDYDTGFVHTLERNLAADEVEAPFPTTLTDTGLFASVPDNLPAAGVVPFEINAPQWQDGAVAEHWLALPGTSAITVYPAPGKPMASQVYWHEFQLHFPADAVLVKTLALDTEPGNPATRRRIETQLLHFDGADWRAYTYAWRDDQSDADLVPARGADMLIELAAPLAAGAGPREYLWHFHDRSQCMQCHNQWPKYTLAFQLGQLNRDVSDGRGGRENQLVWLARSGHLVRHDLDDAPLPPFDRPTAAAEARLADPREADSGTVADRVRAYLHANCSHCHQANAGGGLVGFDLRADTPMEKSLLLERPRRGDFDLPDPRIVVPGHPERSTLYYRMAKFGRERMPHVGSELPDEAALELVAAWIKGLDADSLAAPPRPAESPLGADIGRPDCAVEIARLVGRRELSDDEQDRVLAIAAALPPGTTRDLYEGFLPPDGRGPRLGPNPDPAAILRLAGDVDRGRGLFWSDSSKCGSCHRIGTQGGRIGPELSDIGVRRSAAELLASLLDPSQKIAPEFATHLAVTAEGRAFTGLLVRRDADTVVLKDAEGKEIELAAADIDTLERSPVSLMPAGMLAHWTAQEAADLVAFLAAQREPP